jgi:uncharacterized Zn finger protein
MTINQQESCPLCQGTELVWGEIVTTTYGHYHGVCFYPLESDRLFFKPKLDLLGLACSDCGHVVRFKVKEPEKLKPKKK